MAAPEPKPARTAAATGTATVPASAAKTAAAKPAAKRKGAGGRRRWLRRLFFWFPLLLLIGLVAAGPSLVSWTPLGRQLIARYAPVNGSLEVGWLSIGWFTPLSLGEIVARDASGETLAEVAAVRGDKPLWRLAMNYHDLGRYDVEQPSGHVVVREDGSNIEDFLAPLLSGPSGGGTPISVAIKLTGGQATLDDQPTRRSYQFQDLSLEAGWQGATDQSLSLQSSGKFLDGQNTCELSLLVAAEMGDPAHPLGKGRLSCRCDQLPLDVVEPILRRQLAGAQLAGRVSVGLDGSWGEGDGGGDASLTGQVDVADLLFTAPAMGTDRLEMARLHAPCRIVGKAGRIDIEQLLLDCDLGKLEVTGSVNTADLTPANLLAALPHESCQVTGRLDLVRLAALFPATLSLRPGTEITAGDLNLSFTSQPADGGGNWIGTLATSDLEGMAGGQPLAWKQPLSVKFRCRDAGSGLIVDRLDCTSTFLHVEGSGTADNFTATAEFDLAQLATELGRFVDLASLELSGTGQAKATCQADASGQLGAKCDAGVSNFAIGIPNRRPWHEPQVSIHAEAAGKLDQGALRQVASAALRVTTGSDQLDIQVTQPVENPLSATWPIQLDWQGNLAGLPPRAQPWVDLTGWDLSGQGTFSATATLGAAAIEVQQARGRLEPLHCWGHGLFLDEPAIELTAAGRWQRAGTKIEIPLVGISGGAWVARLNDARLDVSGKTIEANGGATLQADLATIGRWLVDPRTAAPLPMAGQLSGKADWSTKNAISHATLAGTIDNLQVALPAPPARRAAGSPIESLNPLRAAQQQFEPEAQPTAPVWQEQRVSLGIELDFNQTADTLALSRGQLAASAIEGQLEGKIADLTGAPDVNISGQLVADWGRLAPLWKPYAPDKLTIEGSEPWPFSLRGRWTPGATPALAGLKQMVGQATVSWTGANVLGMPINRGSVNAVLKDGTLTIVPIDVAVSGGKVLVSPLIRLAAEPPVIELPRGPAIDHVTLSPQISGEALRFVAPVLCEVTRTSGQFSVELQGGQLPLANPMAGDLAGQLQVHDVEMQPGPILQGLLGFAQQIEGLARGQIPFANAPQAVSLMRIENQTVEFRLVDGRIYHRNLQFTAGNVTITTRGSVGLDETLSMVAEIPMNAGLLGNNSKLKGMNTNSMQIPIEGTLKHPKMDPRAVEKLTASLIKNTTRNLLFNPVEKGIEKLVPGAGGGEPQP